MTTLRSGSATDVGKVRSTNQDVALEDPDLFAVADGMGGHVGGEVAARVAIDALRAAFQRQPNVEGLRRAVAEANRAVWRQGQSESGLRGMGTTLTATALVQESDGRQVIALANVGDSRAYVFSKGQVIQVTADHSLAEEKVRQGQLTEAEAAVHPHRHILTRALGVASDVDVDLWELHLRDGDRILLCSDGLTNEVGVDRIRNALATVADPHDAAETLVRAALDQGGSDNVTCVVVDVVGAGADDLGRRGGTPAGSEAAAVNGADGSAAADGAAAAGGADGSDTPERPRKPGRSVKRGARTARTAAGAAAPTAEDAAEAAAPTAGPAGAGHPVSEPGRRPEGGADNGSSDTTRTLRTVGSGLHANGATDGATDGSPAESHATHGSRHVRRSQTTGPSDAPRASETSLATQGDAGGRSSTTVGVALADRRSSATLSGGRLQAAELRRWQPSRQSRRSRRRASGTPRLVTVRSVLFVVILLAVLAAGYEAVRWYAMDDWYVTVDHGHLAVYRGRPGGFLWFKPQLVDETAVTTSEILPYRLPTVRRQRQEPSLAAAKSYVENLHAEYVASKGLATGTPVGASTATGATTPATGATGASTTPTSALGLPLVSWQ